MIQFRVSHRYHRGFLEAFTITTLRLFSKVELYEDDQLICAAAGFCEGYFRFFVSTYFCHSHCCKSTTYL